MHSSFLGALLHLSDPTLPIGGYTHSNGLETYVQEGIVHNAATAKTFVTQMLQRNIRYNDAAFMARAYQAAEAQNIHRLQQLSLECTALKSPMEIRQASIKLGLRLIKIFRRQQAFEVMELFEQLVQEKEADPHYCIVFGMYARLLNIPLEEALFAFYYNAAVGMITNSVKLVPLGQLEGQDILFQIQPLLKELSETTAGIPDEMLGLCAVAFDIRCMRHERLYSRLYMS
ncbi:urease accessory protein UreF [Niabella drilacis]|uniref:Urease accessory protein UreF n=1 Tax=Niabella drilacis (strain DSM 25811 / CCM 8410 / CCUG 62505 / LMG 26954 / E90) TaxID=1285928 RepID=A0A1G6UXJ9_NIADE|nr:urease accessory protein UreF [Niabella drilacis]SDD45981.1 urease accessory protein [Niabella drilacis]